MADNITTQSSTLASAPAGKTFALDEVSINGNTVLVSLNKLGFGGDGQFSDVTTSAGLPVAQQGTWTVSLASNTAVNLAQYAGTNVGAGNAVHVQPGSGAVFGVAGAAAHDAPVSGNPLLLGAYASAGTPSSVSLDGDAVRLWADLSGRLQIGDGGGSLTVDNGGTFAVQAAQSGTWSVRAQDGSGNALSSTGGSLHVSVQNATLAVTQSGGWSVSQSGTWNIGTVTTVSDASVQGKAAHDAGVSGNPVLIAGYASASAPTNVSADGDVCHFWVDRAGRLQIGDGGGTLSVDDGAGSLTVDNAGTFAVQVTGDALTALQLLDDVVFQDDTAYTPGTSKLIILGAQADETTPDLVDEGDAGALRMTLSRGLHVNVRDDAGDSCMDGTNNALRVNIVAGAGSGGTSAVDDAAFTVGSGSGTPMMGVVTADSVDSGDVGVVGMLANRQLKVTLYDSGGTELAVGGGTQYTEDAAAAANPVGNALIVVRDDARGGSLVSANGDNVALRGTNSGELYVKHVDAVPVTDNGGALTVDNGGTFAVQVTGDALTALQLLDNLVLAEDAVHGSADPGIQMLAVRQDTPSSSTSADGDYSSIKTDSAGRLWTHVGTIDGGTLTTVSDASVQGKAAHDSAVSGNPLLVGGYASAAAPANVSADGDAVRAWFLQNGAQACVLTAAGALVGGDATNGLDVDVTRVGGNVTVVDGGGSLTVDGSVDVGTVTAVSDAQVQGKAGEDAALSGNPVRQGVRASYAEPTAMSADGDMVTPWADRRGRVVTAQKSGTATTSQVSDTATSTTIIAANTQRLGVSVQNDSSAVLYLKVGGGTASSTDYSVRLVQYAYWESAFGFTGAISGIWASDPNDGAARVTEYT